MKKNNYRCHFRKFARYNLVKLSHNLYTLAGILIYEVDLISDVEKSNCIQFSTFFICLCDYVS